MRTSSARHAQRLEVQLQTDGAIPLFSRGMSGSHVKNTNTITTFRQPSQGTPATEPCCPAARCRRRTALTVLAAHATALIPLFSAISPPDQSIAPATNRTIGKPLSRRSPGRQVRHSHTRSRTRPHNTNLPIPWGEG